MDTQRIDENRWARHAQQQRAEACQSSIPGTAEYAEYYGHGEWQGAGRDTERPLEWRDWLSHDKRERAAERDAGLAWTRRPPADPDVLCADMVAQVAAIDDDVTRAACARALILAAQELQREASAHYRGAIRTMRDHGDTFATIGAALGISRARACALAAE